MSPNRLRPHPLPPKSASPRMIWIPLHFQLLRLLSVGWICLNATYQKVVACLWSWLTVGVAHYLSGWKAVAVVAGLDPALSSSPPTVVTRTALFVLRRLPLAAGLGLCSANCLGQLGPTLMVSVNALTGGGTWWAMSSRAPRSTAARSSSAPGLWGTEGMEE